MESCPGLKTWVWVCELLSFLLGRPVVRQQRRWEGTQPEGTCQGVERVRPSVSGVFEAEAKRGRKRVQ